jgi:hypothetical protein
MGGNLVTGRNASNNEKCVCPRVQRGGGGMWQWEN